MIAGRAILHVREIGCKAQGISMPTQASNDADMHGVSCPIKRATDRQPQHRRIGLFLLTALSGAVDISLGFEGGLTLVTIGNQALAFLALLRWRASMAVNDRRGVITR